MPQDIFNYRFKLFSILSHRPEGWHKSADLMETFKTESISFELRYLMFSMETTLELVS